MQNGTVRCILRSGSDNNQNIETSAKLNTFVHR